MRILFIVICERTYNSILYMFSLVLTVILLNIYNRKYELVRLCITTDNLYRIIRQMDALDTE